MPQKKTVARARKLARQGKSPSTQAGGVKLPRYQGGKSSPPTHPAHRGPVLVRKHADLSRAARKGARTRERKAS